MSEGPELRLTPVVDGNASGETLVFLQGWPDDASLWDAAVARLGDRYRCVRVTLPNFDGERASRWGYRTEEIVDAVVELLRVQAAHGPLTLVMHDWGCYWGHAAHHRVPELVSRIVSVDVAPHLKPTAGAAAYIVGYQGWLLGAFVLGGRTGDWMTRGFARLAGAPRESGRLSAWMNYPYRNIWADLASGRSRALTRGYWPRCPMLFVYGAEKPFAFHGDAWLDHVREVGGEVLALPCGHWVPAEPAFVDALARWLSTSSTPSVEA